MTDEIYVGGSAYACIRPESTYGIYDSGGTDDTRIVISNITPTSKNNFIKVFGLGGGRNWVAAVPGKYEVSYTMDVSIQNGAYFKYVLGARSTATTATNDLDGTAITGTPTAALKSYAVTEATNLPSYTMDLRFLVASTNDLQHRLTGNKANQMTLKADSDNELKATFDCLAQSTTTSTGTLTVPTSVMYSDPLKMFYMATLLIGTGDTGTGTGASGTMTDSSKSWTVDQWKTNWVLIDSLGAAFTIASNTATALTVTGTPTTGEYTISPISSYATDKVLYCNSVDVTMTNNLEGYWSITNASGRGIQFAVEKQREYSIDMGLLLTNGEMLGLLYSGSRSATTPATTSTYAVNCLVLNYATATSDGDAFKAMRFVFNNLIVDENSIPIDPKEMIKQNIKAFAKKGTVYYITNETQ
jgi:hypothetical protein